MNHWQKGLCRHLLLTAFPLLLILLPLRAGMFFGSEGDWYSQHVGIAESLRQTMLTTGKFIPQTINLGGTCSIYDVSYYGVLRPDVLLSCLIPKVEMKYIIAVYAILGMLASVNLCVWWLRRQRLSNGFAFAGAMLLAASTCFYHAHHQIMFVNYMPFLILALVGVDRLLTIKKSGLLIVSLFFIYLHSFYYAIACLFVVLLYFLHQMTERRDMDGRSKWGMAGKAAIAAAISIGMAAILLLPTGLDILSTGKDAGSFVNEGIKAVDLSLEGLLYQPYGCGMTVLALYCLFVSLTRKRRQLLSLVLLVCLAIPAAALVLNGFLYARAKILIPLLPLLVFLCADTLQDFYRGKQKYLLLPIMLCTVPLVFHEYQSLVWMDYGLLSLWFAVQQIGRIPDKVKHASYALLFLAPVCVSIGINRTSDTYLSAADTRQSHFTAAEIAEFAADEEYRFEVLANSFVNSNLLAAGTIHKSGMYSSVTNKVYADFYYETMRNPISINNRVALLPSSNSFFNYFMGIRYLLAAEGELPAGYQAVSPKGGYLLAENKDVLPICYATYHLLNVADYQKLTFPDNLEALCSRAVAAAGNTAHFQSHVEEIAAKEFFADGGEQKLLYPSGEKESCVLPLTEELEDKILILTFAVNSPAGRQVTIRINGITNKLASRDAPYPNHNNVFTYVMTGAEGQRELEVEFSKGNYEISNLNIYTLDCSYLKHADIVKPTRSKDFLHDGRTMFEGEITMAKTGYFVTTYPYRDGYRIEVDGDVRAFEQVNTAFIGFPLEKGSHQIRITYEAPGFRTGQLTSIIAFGLLFLLLLKEWKEG